MSEGFYNTLVVCSALAFTATFIAGAIALFATGGVASVESGFQTLSARFVEWRRIAAEADTVRVLLRARCELAEAKLASITKAHEDCQVVGCVTCRALKS